ncbi:prepilin-type N-terminal cleavage/methylation domain-containing protein [Rubinisphaera italica]|uniref:Prepilin-type N-terminal cleavage/methylation domain-containing protein n=1 Tax=Rubinisphaera italica TaxID=2527969 RepID=A0A5C5XJR2_9PLAN|nr:prepilin-type N-terminal cleavage/methylation domain-containing protein [Rubinisphaera italica]TWT62355.1 hypothetical protein Pan54_30960 [Rubinisphaera italica]
MIVKKSGFTLLELLLSVALLSVLISITVPTINALLYRQQMLDVVGRIEQFLNNQRRDAVRSGQPRWIRFSSGDHVLIAGVFNEPATSSVTLPESLKFGFSDFAETLTSEQLGELGLNSQEHRWSPEMLYFADGTASGMIFLIEEESKKGYLFEVSTLNGYVSIDQHTPDRLEALRP